MLSKQRGRSLFFFAQQNKGYEYFDYPGKREGCHHEDGLQKTESLGKT
jgi:hypothetical protein